MDLDDHKLLNINKSGKVIIKYECFSVAQQKTFFFSTV